MDGGTDTFLNKRRVIEDLHREFEKLSPFRVNRSVPFLNAQCGQWIHGQPRTGEQVAGGHH